MPINLLNRTEYHTTFRESMQRLDPEEISDPVAIGDYVTECLQVHQLPASLENVDIEHVYLSGDQAFTHIVLSYGQRDTRLIVIINQQARQIYGHYLLDLSAEYGRNDVAP
jgi:endo-1,4-beta-mannosidase